MNRLNYLRKEARKVEILGHIVNSYVSTAMPVSSRLVAQRMGSRMSSATIRNIMAELEDEGYIEQPHTSAGRIPTNPGYRLYVDMVRDRIETEKEEARRLSVEYSRRIRSIKEVIETTSRLISRELHSAGIVMWPSIGDYYLKHIELVKVRAETILAVLVTMTNAVKNHIIRLDRELEIAELEKIANYININYERVSFPDISEKLRLSLKSSGPEDASPVSTAKAALSIIDTVVEEDIGNEIYWEGLNYFMDEPEFRNAGLSRSILHIFSDRRDLVRLLRRELSYEGLRVHIGSEDGCKVLNGCSIVTCGYELHGRTAGRIGVIGPTRMDYDRALRTVKCLSGLVSGKLSELEG